MRLIGGKFTSSAIWLVFCRYMTGIQRQRGAIVFFATRDGSPFSSDLNNALEQCITLRYLTSDETSQERVFSLTDEGSESLYGLRTLTRCQSRGVFIEASCSSALATPSGLVRRAITPEPDLRAARALNSN